MTATYYIGKPSQLGKLYKFKSDSIADDEKARLESLGYLVRKVTKPSMKMLEKWTFDSVCKSVGGKDVEPDGYDANGYPSWLLVSGII